MQQKFGGDILVKGVHILFEAEQKRGLTSSGIKMFQIAFLANWVQC